MHTGLSANESGIPLFLFNEQEGKDWLNQQTAATQAWLSNIGFDNQGLALVQDADGSIAQAVYVTKSEADLFTWASLQKELPKTTFRVEAERDRAVNCAIAFGLAQYEFTRYKSSTATKAQLTFADETIVTDANRFIEAAYLVRDMINTPANDMMPQHMAELSETVAKQFKAEFKQVVGEQLLSENYPMIHAVGRASDHAPRLLELTWGNPEHPKVTIVGKGVCFDSGGLDLKPSSAMRLMKKDMGGAAHALGLAHLVMSHNLPICLRVLIPSVENAVSGDAFRPGDVLPTRKGLTIEIDNTDAEGRLVLCDALTDACEQSPELVIDFATLTGACRVALGTELPGFFTNDASIAPELMAAGVQAQDPVWNLPLHQPYKDMLKSDIADMVNCASSPFGGAITAALYLEAFIENTNWVHFDVMAWNNRALPGRPVGGEAMGIRAVFQYLQTRFA